MSKSNSPWATFKQEVAGTMKEAKGEMAEKKNTSNRGSKWAGLILTIPLALFGLVLLAIGFAIIFL